MKNTGACKKKRENEDLSTTVQYEKKDEVCMKHDANIAKQCGKEQVSIVWFCNFVYVICTEVKQTYNFFELHM